MKKVEFVEIIAFISIVGGSSRMFSRGFFWSKEQETILHDSPFYVALHEIMPIWIWGIIVMAFSLILMSSAFFIPSQKLNNKCNYLMLIGGLGCAILYFLMTSASIYHAINWLSTAQFAISTVVCGLLAFVGGADIYGRRK
ncbi:hypothetical protein ACE3LZ_03150 [Staphylococcus saprophyticus]|uniref:hypothetical protein n=1 Tax=Staphylococcus saprophyticus TaxID=29385 RepID=UPI0009907679|nr:hypothetical protein [Staphylococcus saprophyticus]MBF2751514.1 hypothetical protein [Staphylococcus saprophyticus]MDW3894439.1 hypothetical protein [Staphylococcus saprophyticus]OOO71617.1 hypothetical protein B0W56_06675 [Staphylococcus saprophyticus]